jgi:ADP-heptose:LPS heptosyltransferase
MPEKHMGNVIVSLPSILSISNFFKDVNLSILIDERYTDIIDTFIENVSIIPYPRMRIKNAPFYKKIILFYSIVKKLRIQKPDIIFDLEGRSVGPIQSFLSGSKIKIGFESSDKSYLYNIKVPSKGRMHKSHQYLLIPRYLGFNTNLNLQLRIKELWLKELAKKINLHDKIISIHPSAGKIYKKWPFVKFAKFGDYFAEKGYKICFIGSLKDREDVRKVVKIMNKDSIDLSGKLTIGELIVLLRSSSLFLGNDSGPMHLSALIGTPTIALFGPADENRWAPLGKRFVVLRGGFRCNKCKGRDCNLEFKCTTDIKVEAVISSAEQLLIDKNDS